MMNIQEELDRIEKLIDEDGAGFWTARSVLDTLRAALKRKEEAQRREGAECS